MEHGRSSKLRVLFVLKKNYTYGFISYTRRSSGLWNSTRFISESLNQCGVNAEIIEVVDNNDIDRNVTALKPDIVIIEALWVVPEKFDVLKKLHPNVKWMCHMHSGLPFLALEGIAMDWLKGYAPRDLTVIANSKETYEAFRSFLPHKHVEYLPNVYISKPLSVNRSQGPKDTIRIGCFGALRPMKNHLHQAIAAINYAHKHNKKLEFHINSSRVETGGQPVLKNLVQLFEHQANAKLIQCDWMEPEQFIEYLHKNIDIGMQVSMTETFNVVCADYVTAGVPVVISEQVKWASSLNVAKDDCILDTVRIMERVYRNKILAKWNQYLLITNAERAVDMWVEFIKE